MIKTFEKYKQEVISLGHELIINWGNYLETNCLRGFLLLTFQGLTLNEAVEVYNICYKRKVYPHIEVSLTMLFLVNLRVIFLGQRRTNYNPKKHLS